MIRYLDGRQVTDAGTATNSNVLSKKLVLATLGVSAFIIVVAFVYYWRMA